MLNYDLLPAEWASGNSTMRFLVENCVRKVFSEFFEISISMQSRSRCNLATVTEMNRDRDFHLLILSARPFPRAVFDGRMQRGRRRDGEWSGRRHMLLHGLEQRSLHVAPEAALAIILNSSLVRSDISVPLAAGHL